MVKVSALRLTLSLSCKSFTQFISSHLPTKLLLYIVGIDTKRLQNNIAISCISVVTASPALLLHFKISPFKDMVPTMTLKHSWLVASSDYIHQQWHWFWLKMIFTNSFKQWKVSNFMLDAMPNPRYPTEILFHKIIWWLSNHDPSSSHIHILHRILKQSWSFFFVPYGGAFRLAMGVPLVIIHFFQGFSMK